jgi:hypothetical protein
MGDFDEKRDGSPHRKVYARGFFDGMKAATGDSKWKPKRDEMNEAKHNSMIKGLTSAAAKVYQATPISTPWTASQISAELFRTGCRLDIKAVAGCLLSLTNQHLIVERGKGEFIRVQVKPKQESIKDEAEPAAGLKALSSIIEKSKQADPKEIKMPAKPEQAQKDPIDKLSALSAKARLIGGQLTDLANEIDNAALEITEQMTSTDAETQKLQQLKQLLKSLG